MTTTSTDLHLFPSSADLDPLMLEPGRHAVLDIPPRHGVIVPDGVLTDDHLDSAARQAVNEEAQQALSVWRERHEAEARVGSLSIVEIWQSELLGEVFLPSVRLVHGVCATAKASGARRLVTHRLDPELTQALARALDPLPVEARAPGPVERYPTEAGSPPGTRLSAPRWRTLARALLDIVGLPSLIRGSLVIVSYYSTEPVIAQLAVNNGPRPVLYAAIPPSPTLALRAALQGGWIGLPGRRGRSRAERSLSAALDRIRVEETDLPGAPGLGGLLHRRAMRCLSDRAGANLALAQVVDRALARGRVDAVLVPFDAEPVTKVLVRTAQSRGVPVLALQHGYEPFKTFVPGEFSDAIGQWSGTDFEALPPDRQARARVIGNPGRGEMRPSAAVPGGRPHAVVLVEHRSRMSALLDRRISAVHLATALDGLDRSRHDWTVTVRPHPSDDPGEFRALLDQLGRGEALIDGHTPITELLASAHLCVGALSTVALQTALTGTRLVMLRPKPLDILPPLDGSGQVLHATTAAELAEAVDAAMDASDPPGRAELLDALGFGPPDPVASVLDWAHELALGARAA